MKTNPIFFLLLILLCGCARTKFTHGIPNLAAVDTGIWRGGQPTSEGWEWLKSQGVIYDIKLNTQGEASDSLAKINGIKILEFPITLEQQFSGAGVSNVIARASNFIVPGTYIHCEYGKNRTGTLIGYYRVTHDGWTKKRAEEEMNLLGWGDSLPGLKWFWNTGVNPPMAPP